MRAPATSENLPAGGKFPARARGLSIFLLGGGLAVALTAAGAAPDANWPEALLLLLATAATLVALARQLPGQNVLFAAAIIALVGGGISALGGKTALPFGPFLFGATMGPQLFKTLPWMMPLVWVVIILNSRGVARLILRPWRKTRTYGFWLMGVTAALVTTFDCAFDPFASRVKHFWIWEQMKFPLSWQGAPLVNFFGWGMVTLLLLVFVTPLLINKQLSKRSAPDYHPLAVWLGAVLLFGVASARHGLWPVVAADGAIALVTAGFAIRGGRW